MPVGVWTVGLGGGRVHGVALGQGCDVLDNCSGLHEEEIHLKINLKTKLWKHIEREIRIVKAVRSVQKIIFPILVF